ncbi:hypothetical protein [Pedobacter steynii]|uniref:Uncharacterized protein n=1 Tax=Pedobacter steynii TaxID=430522 RepID=A0A1D7QP99_9SPHI|nr:hypothetical protein [Pedobacter steynii]AOM80502.1 hypothetical protein BFS30_27095 [Pedobacter steynii]
MDSTRTFFKEERDPYYIKGFQKGVENGKNRERARASAEFAERLILGTNHTDEIIAILAGVTIAFVKAKRHSVAKKNRIKK